MVAVVIIVLVSLLTLLIVVLSVLTRNSMEVTRTNVENSSVTLSGILNHYYEVQSEKDPEAKFDMEEHISDHKAMYRWLVRFCLFNTTSEKIFIVDASGKVILAKASDAQDIGLYELGDDVGKDMLSALSHNHFPIEEGVYKKLSWPEKAILSSASLYAGGDEPVGFVLVAGLIQPLNSSNAKLAANLMIATLGCLISIFVVLYFVTDRFVNPLRQLSRAAGKLGKGHFNVRVPVRGNDEVAELATKFNTMAETLERTEETRSTLLANFAHDIRTPLTVIAGYIDNIRCGAIKAEDIDKYSTVILSEVKRLARMVDKMLQLSKLEERKRMYSKTRFDVCEMSRQILISLESRIEEKELEVEFMAEEDQIPVCSDPDALFEAMYNICDNAVKFSRNQGLLRITIGRTGSSENGKASDSHIRVSVYNEGEGISKEDEQHIFERFYKGDKSRSLDKSGTGLGMYITKTILTALGGRIWVSGEPGHHCEFIFTLPADMPEDHLTAALSPDETTKEA